MSRKIKRGELLKAFTRGNIEKVLILAEDIPDPEKVKIPEIVTRYRVFKSRTTPLNMAIENGNYHLCRLLVQDGHSLTGEEVKCSYLRPLSLALSLKHSDIAELLIKSGADVNLLETDMNTYPLFWAVHVKQSPHIIDEILSAGFPVNAVVMKKEKMTALQCAVLENNIEAVKALLKYPVDLNILNASHETALCIAIRRNFPEIVQLLVNRGADLHCRNPLICPLFVAIRYNHLKMVELLLSLGADLQEGWVGQDIVPSLQYAISYMDVCIVLLLINRGADVKARHPDSLETALHVTATPIGYDSRKKDILAVQIIIAKALIGKGADVNARDACFKTPLDGAILAENTELCKLLLREGADMLMSNGSLMNNVLFGQPLANPFEYICCVSEFKCPELVRLGLERGGDYNYRDKHGLTPYHCVMAKHNHEMMRAFWQHGCPYDQPELIPGKMRDMLLYKPNTKDKRLFALQSDFIDGIKHNRLDSVLNALKRGAEPKGCSVRIPSTLHYVAANGNHKIAQVLLENGVAVNKLNDKGQTPLYVAVEKKNLPTCKVLLQHGACFDYKSRKLCKNKLIKVIAKENDPIHSLFTKVYKCFKLAKRGDYKLLAILNKNLKEEGMINVLMNCVNSKGFTLLAVLLNHGHRNLAEDLMLFRLENMSV